jgi:hypothetical protein
MKQKDTEIQPELTNPETLDTSKSPTQSEPATTLTKAEKPQPSTLQRIFRKVLIWLVIFAIGFLAGIVTDNYLRYKPLSEANVKTQEALNRTNEDEKKVLRDELEMATAHLELLQVLVDVSNARMALFLNDVEGAKAALVNTQQRLDNLLPSIAEFDTDLAQSMPQRLNLIVSGLERDTETVKIDLELFTKDLLEIEAAVFGD